MAVSHCHVTTVVPDSRLFERSMLLLFDVGTIRRQFLSVAIFGLIAAAAWVAGSKAASLANSEEQLRW